MREAVRTFSDVYLERSYALAEATVVLELTRGEAQALRAIINYPDQETYDANSDALDSIAGALP